MGLRIAFSSRLKEYLEHGARWTGRLEGLSSTYLRGSRRVTTKTAEGSYQALEKYGRDLNELASEGKLDPVIGRDEEIPRATRENLYVRVGSM
ncbi:unnamed protein product [Vitrella brassicaformis CCMP3155]|uniref:Uncharacterized protein n=1 Tax=Vitrella brassicaformis (strain CCMP3155) TaxID=1169540 RepID=A0A0G4H156_VITBC|nr:unnamed protein product [Vitrella brassicaformis CCMP3155]|eukprot:CEM37146.1 unnamed protein product [Vitrella brassicaformis CCMP3155]